jgi:hypothetical protein
METRTPQQARKMILEGTAPDNMEVDGSLNLSNSKKLTGLPKGFRVEGWLYLENCTALTELPDGLCVLGNLKLGGCTALKHLPKDLRVKCNLHLEGCTALTNLSDGLIVGLSLYLWGCNQLKALPADLNVGGCIVLNHSLSIPDTVHCESFVFRDVSRFPRKFINNPHSITAADVINERNAQKRSMFLELMRIQRFMREVTPAIVHQDVEHNGNVRQLLRVEMPTAKDIFEADVQEEPIVMLSVTCPSTAHHYMLRVPPNMQTCHQAAAWIAGFDDPEQYQPVMET